MEKGAVEPGTVVEDQQMALEREGLLGGEDDHAIRRCHDRRAGPRGDVDAGVISPRLAALVGPL